MQFAALQLGSAAPRCAKHVLLVGFNGEQPLSLSVGTARGPWPAALGWLCGIIGSSFSMEGNETTGILEVRSIFK